MDYLSRVIWPAVLQFGEDPELLFLEDERAFRELENHPVVPLDEKDRLIDATGHFYFPKVLQGTVVDLVMDGSIMSLEEFLGLVKAHAAVTGSCCVAKLWAPSFPEALRIVQSFKDA